MGGDCAENLLYMLNVSKAIIMYVRNGNVGAKNRKAKLKRQEALSRFTVRRVFPSLIPLNNP